jgi:hypothetical protein
MYEQLIDLAEWGTSKPTLVYCATIWCVRRTKTTSKLNNSIKHTYKLVRPNARAALKSRFQKLGSNVMSHYSLIVCALRQNAEICLNCL